VLSKLVILKSIMEVYNALHQYLLRCISTLVDISYSVIMSR
jgi:hypothetical protein